MACMPAACLLIWVKVPEHKLLPCFPVFCWTIYDIIVTAMQAYEVDVDASHATVCRIIEAMPVISMRSDCTMYRLDQGHIGIPV